MTGGRFERCLRFTLREEGGLVNDPEDKGKLTNRGVTQATLDAAHLEGVINTGVKTPAELTEAQVETIFFGMYWMRSHAFEFPAPLDLCLFDAYVNHRPATAIKLLQAAIVVDQDGKVGPKTIARAHEVNLAAAIERYAFAREQLYRRIVAEDASQTKFLRGWLNRVAAVKSAALLEVA